MKQFTYNVILQLVNLLINWKSLLIQFAIANKAAIYLTPAVIFCVVLSLKIIIINLVR